MFSNAHEELQSLKDAILHYQTKSNPDFQHSSEITDSRISWDHVKEAVEAVRASEDGRDNKSMSTRRLCNKIVENVSSFETWLELLPSGDYGAAVSGVFKIIVGVLTVSIYISGGLQS